ncbi:gp53-like domain-containing protein, partial [Escherichia coli]
MQNLMPPINTPDQLFHDGDPTQGIEGTLVTAGYLNNQQGATRDLQQELLNVLGGAHIQPDPQKTDQLLTALRALLLSRKNPFGDIKLDGTVQKALENLGLGEAATRNVGTETGQVPDMSSFTTGHSGAADWPIPKSGWSKGP